MKMGKDDDYSENGDDDSSESDANKVACDNRGEATNIDEDDDDYAGNNDYDDNSL